MSRTASTKKAISISTSILIFTFLFWGCVNPVKPEFEFRNDIIFVDAYALTETGTSSVSIRRSVLINDRFETEGINNSEVTLLNTQNETTITFTESVSGLYLPPKDFVVKEGETWQLLIQLENGKRYESQPETVRAGVPIENIDATYEEELLFLESKRAFVPGHRVSIDWTDPAGENNYYLWKYRTYEPISVCLTCDKGMYRNDNCQIEPNRFRTRRYDYLCETSCWQIRSNDKFQIYDDRLTDGQRIDARPIADLPLYRKRDILIEIQQLSLSKTAYDYFTIISDASEKGSGLNAPPPAALLGNLYNPNDLDETVLGQFSATTSKTLTLFISRSTIETQQIDPIYSPQTEDPAVPGNLLYVPCEESPFRTAIKPEGWE